MHRRELPGRYFRRWVFLGALGVGLVTTAHAEQAKSIAAPQDIPYFDIYIIQSGPITWFVQIPISVAVVALIIRYALLIRRKAFVPTTTRDQVSQLFQARQYREAMEFAAGDPSMLGHVVHASLAEAPNGFAAMQRTVTEAAEERSVTLMRQIEWLNLIGNVAPMIGLFGTVWGMILAFWALVDIVQKGGVTDAAQLAFGIMQALGTTFWGLLEAIPALTAFSFFRNRVDVLTAECARTAEELIDVFKPGPKRPAQA